MEMRKKFTIIYVKYDPDIEKKKTETVEVDKIKLIVQTSPTLRIGKEAGDHWQHPNIIIYDQIFDYSDWEPWWSTDMRAPHLIGKVDKVGDITWYAHGPWMKLGKDPV